MSNTTTALNVNLRLMQLFIQSHLSYIVKSDGKAVVSSEKNFSKLEKKMVASGAFCPSSYSVSMLTSLNFQQVAP